ncbi:unnamed protein product [Amaranthus hypochondriacus]
MMNCRQRREESLNEYVARFSIECLAVYKLENSIILLAFKSGLNDDRSKSKMFKEDDGWINIHYMDDVREGAKRFTASANFKHIASSLRGDKQEKKNNNNNNKRDLYPDHSHNGQDRRNKGKGPDVERSHMEESKRPTL